MRWRHWVYLAVALLVAAVVAPLINETHKPDGAIWHAATFFGSILITVGWVVTSETAIRNSKRQHTIALITAHIFDKTRADNRKIIRETLPTSETRLSPEMVGSFDLETSPPLEAIDIDSSFDHSARGGD